MILWTLQDPIVWKTLQAKGTWSADFSHIAFSADDDNNTCHAHYAYRWLASQMKARIGQPPAGVVFPIWAWYEQGGKCSGKPDMRKRHGNSGDPVDRIKLEVAADRVLLSDFDDWHYPLNYWPFSQTEKLAQVFEDWCAAAEVDMRSLGDWDLDSPSLREGRKRLETSWNFIFDIHSPRDTEWLGSQKDRAIQATLWQLHFEDVASVEHFVVR